jgi:hypothetical protein
VTAAFVKFLFAGRQLAPAELIGNLQFVICKAKTGPKNLSPFANYKSQIANWAHPLH